MTNIDIVYTWVDSSDENWIKTKKYFWNKTRHGDNRSCRFPSQLNASGELQLSIETILTYAKWVNNIYVITMRPQIPNLSNVILNRIKIIHHDEIWKIPESLPSFNSHAIETNLHRIKDLNEHFIYFNDDCYLSDYINPQDYFDNDMPKISIDPFVTKKKNSGLYDAYTNSHVNLFNITLNNYIHQSHHAVPLTKSLMKDAEKYYGELWISTMKNKFRSKNDIPPITAVITYGNMTNKIIKTTNNVFYTRNETDYINSNYNGKFVCINDNHFDNNDGLKKLKNKLFNSNNRSNINPIIENKYINLTKKINDAKKVMNNNNDQNNIKQIKTNKQSQKPKNTTNKKISNHQKKFLEINQTSFGPQKMSNHQKNLLGINQPSFDPQKMSNHQKNLLYGHNLKFKNMEKTNNLSNNHMFNNHHNTHKSYISPKKNKYPDIFPT